MATKRALQGTTDQSPPWLPCPTTEEEVRAIQAMAWGEATKDQQMLFVKWMQKATSVGELEFRADSERASNFAAGKRFVGLQFFTLVKAKIPPAGKPA